MADKTINLLFSSNKQRLANFDSPPEQVKNILCMTAAGIGDVIMEMPAINALKKKFPVAKITVLTHFNRGASEVCKLAPCVDETIDIGLKNFQWPTVIKFMLGGFWKILFQLRRKRFDLSVVFWPNPARKFLLAGLNSKYWMCNNKKDDFPGQQNRDLLKLIRIENIETKNIFRIPEPPNERNILPENLQRPFIGIHPFCGMRWRQWRKFEALEERLAKHAGTIIVVGNQKNYNFEGPGLNLVNKLSISELFWFIKQCDIFVTADSGPMHISLSLGIPTVAIFGPIKPSLRIDKNETTAHIILYKPTEESEKAIYATQRKTLTNESMQTITVDEVLDAIKKIIK